MKSRTRILWIAWIVLSAAGAAASGAERPSVPDDLDSRSIALLQKVRSAYENIRSVEAEFDQTNNWELVEPAVPYHGRLYVEAGGRVRLEYEEPKGHVLVADGEWLWTYVPESAQVIKSRLGSQGGVVARLFLDFLAGQRVRAVSWLADHAEIVLEPDPVLGLHELRVEVDGQGIGRRFVWTDLEGNTSEYVIRDSRMNVALGDSLFRFDPPPGVDVVELDG
jgi:outer membrane lipoprotein carrier protein